MLLPILLIGPGILFMLGSIIALDMIRQGDQRFVRIDHEEFFFSPLLSTVVKWSDISTLVPYTWIFMGSRRIDFTSEAVNACCGRLVKKSS